MSSTAARKPVELNPSVRGSLDSHGFHCVRVASMTWGPSLWAHALAPEMRISVSMSNRIEPAVLWQVTQAPAELRLAPTVNRSNPDQFESAMSDLQAKIVNQYTVGGLPRVAGPIAEDVYTDSATEF